MAGRSAVISAFASARVWSRGCVVALGLLVALAPAVAAESRSRCRQMTRQIAHYYDVKDMASDRGDEMWQQGTERQILRLEVRQRKLCPAYLASVEQSRMKKAAEETKQFFRAAAKAAARYFTFGGL